MPESPPQEPTIALSPLGLVAIVGLWYGLLRRRPLAAAIGVAAAAAEFGWPAYKRLERRWTVVSAADDAAPSSES